MTTRDGCYMFRIAADGSMRLTNDRPLEERFSALQYAVTCGEYMGAEDEPILYLEIVNDEVSDGFFAPFIIGHMNSFTEGERIVVSRATEAHEGKACAALIKLWNAAGISE